jgi:YD repeat-containing protein
MHSKAFSLIILFLAALSPVNWAENPASESKDTVIHQDEQGRLTLVEEATNTTSFNYDESGTLLSKQSSRFGKTEYTYSSSKKKGPFAQIRTKRQLSERGTWERQLIYSREGHLALRLEGIDKRTLSRIVSRLEPYFWPSGLRNRSFEGLSPIEGHDFASLSVVDLNDGTQIQRSRVFEQDMEIRTEFLTAGERRISFDGERRVSDDDGKERIEVWSEGALLSAFDQHGPILEAELDAFLRPARITVGGTIVLWFDYEGGNREWSRRHATNLIGEDLIGSWKVADDFDKLEEAPMPRKTALAFLPGSVPVAEWDSDLLPEGQVLIYRLGTPYALIPFGGDEEIWRSITTSFKGVVRTDRIDYTDSQIRLHLSLGQASIAAGSEAMIVIERERRFPHSVEVEVR